MRKLYRCHSMQHPITSETSASVAYFDLPTSYQLSHYLLLIATLKGQQPVLFFYCY